MNQAGRHRNGILFFWTQNLVESPTIFSFNLIVSFIAGIVYSFRIIESDYLLLIFGVVSPILFTVCLYSLLFNSQGSVLGQPLPKAFTKIELNRFIMFLDCFIILLFAGFIHFDLLNFFVFRFLQTLFFPILLLIMLKGFYYTLYQQ